MPNLNDLRAQLPDVLGGLDDEAAIDVLQQAYYPEFEREAIAAKLGVKLIERCLPKQTTG